MNLVFQDKVWRHLNLGLIYQYIFYVSVNHKYLHEHPTKNMWKYRQVLHLYTCANYICMCYLLLYTCLQIQGLPPDTQFIVFWSPDSGAHSWWKETISLLAAETQWISYNCLKYSYQDEPVFNSYPLTMPAICMMMYTKCTNEWDLKWGMDSGNAL